MLSSFSQLLSFMKKLLHDQEMKKTINSGDCTTSTVTRNALGLLINRDLSFRSKQVIGWGVPLLLTIIQATNADKRGLERYKLRFVIVYNRLQSTNKSNQQYLLRNFHFAAERK